MAAEVTQFTDEYFAIVNKMTDAVQQMIGAGLSKEEILIIISKRDFKKTILNDPQFKSSFNKLNGTYVSTLKQMKKFADISEDAILALTKVNQATFMNSLADDNALTLKRNLTNGVLGGFSQAQIVKSITSDLRPDQIGTLVHTALANYTAGLNALMADQLPANVSYVYTGPTDKKTRDVCLEMMSAGPMTQEEISDRYPGAWIGRGGFNCRHQWSPYRKEVPFYNPSKALSLMKPN